MTTLSTLDFDSGANGANVTASAPYTYLLGAGGSVNTYSTAAAIHGARAMACTDVAHQNAVKYDNTTAIPTMVSSYYFRINTLAAGLQYLGEIRDATNVKICDWRLSTTGQVVLRNSSSVAVGNSGTTLLATATVYRVEHSVSASAQQLKVFVGESTTAYYDSGSLATGTTNTPRYAICGNIAASTAPGAVDFDTWLIADTWTGPFVVAGAILATRLFDTGPDGAAVASTGAFSYLLGSGGTQNTYSAAAAIHGTFGMRCTDVAHQNTVKYDNSTAIPTMVSSFYFQINTIPAADFYLSQFNDNSNVKICDWRVNTAGGVYTISVRDSTSVARYTSSAVLVVGNRYRVEHRVSASTQQFRVYDRESTTVLIDSGAITTGTTNTPRYSYCGMQAASTGPGQIDFDTYRVSTDWVGPYGTESTPFYVVQVRKSGAWIPTVIRINPATFTSYPSLTLTPSLTLLPKAG